MSLIKIRNLHKAFGSHKVLRGLNLDITEGETLVILGRSGVGKSVLLKQIIGVDKPDQGFVEIHGTNITELEESELYQVIKGMGMLFQGGALFDSMTIGENVAFHLTQHGNPCEQVPLTEQEIDQRVAQALYMVGLEGKESLMPSELSGGMRKRAALARLIVYRPKIILYDEPTTGLDAITSKQINDLIIKTQKELKATSIVITHNIMTAMTVADRVAVFDPEKMISTIISAQDFREGKLPDDPLLKSFYENAFYGKKEK